MLHCFSGLISYLTENTQCSTVSSTSAHTTSKTFYVILHTAEWLSHSQRHYILVYVEIKTGWLQITFASSRYNTAYTEKKPGWLNEDKARASKCKTPQCGEHWGRHPSYKNLQGPIFRLLKLRPRSNSCLNAVVSERNFKSEAMIWRSLIKN